MQCPNCRKTTLKPTKLEAGLPAMGCNQCAGAFLSLLSYRLWAERHSSEGIAHTKLKAVDDTQDRHAAMHCPKCGRIMTKFRITGEVGNRIDLCASCDEAWLDKGEWTLLKALALSDQLPAVFTEEWQHKVRKQVNEDMRKQRYIKLLGEKDLNEAERIRQWLLTHPHRRNLLDYLNHE